MRIGTAGAEDAKNQNVNKLRQRKRRNTAIRIIEPVLFFGSALKPEELRPAQALAHDIIIESLRRLGKKSYDDSDYAYLTL